MAVSPLLLPCHPPPDLESPVVVFELVPSRPLPTIDCARLIKHVVFSGPQLRLVNAFLHRFKHALSLVFLGGFLSSMALPVVSAPIGRWIGVSLLASELVPIVATVISLRFDLVVLLFGMYETWFATALNALVTLLMAMHFADVRGIGPALAFVGCELVVLLDATIRGVRHAILFAILGAVMYSLFGTYVAFGLIDAHADPVLVSYGPRQLHVSDVLANGLFTAIILFLRNAYRKRAAMVEGARNNHVVPCITYRCHLRLHPVCQPMAPATTCTDSCGSSSVVPSNALTAGGADAATPAPELVVVACRSRVPLRYAPTRRQVFAPQQILIWAVPRQLTAIEGLGLYGLGTVGLVCAHAPIILVAVGGRPWPFQAGLSAAIASVAVAATGSFCGVFWANTQRELLLHELLRSFDFLFLSAQLTFADLAVADLLGWDHRALGVLASWLWFHWVLALDALLPTHRRRLRLARGFVAAVLGLAVAQQLALALGIVAVGRWTAEDRALVAVDVWGRTVEVRVVAFLLSRLGTVLTWSARLLWRLHRGRDGELLVLQGRVEFEDATRPGRHGGMGR